MENMLTQTQGVINYDFESAKAKIKERLDIYRGAVFTEESKTIAKKEVANLRKEKFAFSERVKEVKAEYMKPYLDFEAKAKELIAMYDEPINLINGQVQEFEARRRKEKCSLISKIYQEEVVSVLPVHIPISMFYDKRWENATYKEKEIRKDMSEFSKKVIGDIATIKSMNSPDEERAIDLYLNSFDISKSILFMNENAKIREDALRREQERIKREEEERIRREEREKLEAERRHQEELQRAKEEEERKRLEEIRRIEEEKEKAIEEAKEEAVEALTPDFVGESNLYEYRISLTSDAKQKLEMYMDSVGIEWEMI